MLMQTLLPVLCAVLCAGAAPAKLRVVATTPDLAALAREVGGDRVEVTSLAKPTEDAHFVDAKPSFIVKLNRADALIEGGAELEAGWLPPLLQGARNPKLATGNPGRIVGSHGIALLEVPAELDRSKGDVHSSGNPHFLMDPLNARAVAARISDALARLEPESEAVFRSNLALFTSALDVKLAAWQKALEPFRGRRVVSYHNSWPYLTARFGVKVDVFLEPKPGLPPTPAHLAEVIATMKREGIRVILVEPQLSRRTAQAVARNTGAALVEVAQFPGGVKGTDGGYIALMDHIVSSLAKALQTPK